MFFHSVFFIKTHKCHELVIHAINNDDKILFSLNFATKNDEYYKQKYSDQRKTEIE